MNNNIAHALSHKLIIEELETRQLFSGGVEGVMVQELPPQPAATYLDIASTTNSTAQSTPTVAANTQAQNDVRQELVLIDTDVKNYQELLNDIYNQADAERNIQVILLDNNSDGIQQIGQALSQYRHLDAVHLISHGSDGSLDIGNSKLSLDDLNQSQSAISLWSVSFSEQGDFLIYGCNLASTKAGLSLIDTLSKLTGTDIAASDDLTGYAGLGGDWDLEYKTSRIESNIALNATGRAQWQGVLTNIAPTATNLNAAEIYTEDTALNLVDIVITDVDSAAVTITLTLSNVATGSLNTGTSGAVTSTYNAGTGVWTASGATADVNSLLAGLTFTPTANFNGNFTITTSAGDGSLTVAGTKTMAGAAVNDAPIASGATSLTPALEDALSPSGATVSSLFAGNFSDLADSGNPGQDQFVGVGVRGQTVNAAKGRWQYSTDSGVNWNNFGAISDTNALGLHLNDSLRFLPAANYSGAPNNLTVRLIDNSTTFTSGATVNISTRGGITAFSNATVAVSTSITPVADTPSATNATTNEDTQSTSALIISRNTADGAEVTHFKISSITQGTLYKNDGTTQISNGTFITYAEGNAGLKFTPTADFNDVGSFTVQASTSNGDAGLGGSTVNASITVAPVNDAPAATNLSATESYAEDTVLNLTGIVITDGDSTTITTTLTLSEVAAGTLNTGSSGSVTSTFAAGVWNASGAIADVNALLAGLAFTPTANFNGNFTIATNVSDGMAAAVIGSKAMIGTPVNDASTGTVSIIGTPLPDQTLSIINTLADAGGLGSIRYQWQANGVDIRGATGSSYVVGNITVPPVALGIPQGSVNNTASHSVAYIDTPDKANVVSDGKTSLSNKIITVMNLPKDIVIINVDPAQQTETAVTNSDNPKSMADQPKENRLTANFRDLPANSKTDYPVDRDHIFTQREEQALWQHIDAIRHQHELDRNALEINVHVVSAVTLTAAFVSWALRNGTLLAGLLSVPLKAVRTTLDSCRR